MRVLAMYHRLTLWLSRRKSYRKPLRIYEKPSQFPSIADYRVSSEMKGKR